jgi:hypothetical protein
MGWFVDEESMMNRWFVDDLSMNCYWSIFYKSMIYPWIGIDQFSINLWFIHELALIIFLQIYDDLRRIGDGADEGVVRRVWW